MTTPEQPTPEEKTKKIRERDEAMPVGCKEHGTHITTTWWGCPQCILDLRTELADRDAKLSLAVEAMTTLYEEVREGGVKNISVETVVNLSNALAKIAPSPPHQNTP